MVVELMGYVKMAGRVSEIEQFGAKMARIDMPQPDGSFLTQFFRGESVYRLTVVDEATARFVALKYVQAPVQPWEMPQPGRSALAEAAAVEDLVVTGAGEIRPATPEEVDRHLKSNRDWRYHNTDPDSDGSDY